MKVSENALEKLQETERTLAAKGFQSVWQKIVERFPFDDFYSFWVNLETGKSVLLKTHSDYYNSLDGVFAYELNEIDLNTLEDGQKLVNKQ